MELSWECIDLNLYRMCIYGGWLVKYEVPVMIMIEGQGITPGWDNRSSICFVPDEGHYWKIHKKVEA